MPIAGSGSEIRSQATTAARTRNKRRQRRVVTEAMAPFMGPGPAGQQRAREDERRRTPTLAETQQHARRLHGAYAPPTQRVPGQGRRHPGPSRAGRAFFEAAGPGEEIVARADIEGWIQRQRQIQEAQFARALSGPHGPPPTRQDLIKQEQTRRKDFLANSPLLQIPEDQRTPQQRLVANAMERNIAKASLEPGLSFGERFLSQLTSAAYYVPAGIYGIEQALQHDITRSLPFTSGGLGFGETGELAKQMGESLYEDVRHPIRNIGYLTSDIWGLAGGGLGIGFRVGKAAGAARAAGSLREGVGGVTRALVGPLPPAHRIWAHDVMEPQPTSVLGRVVSGAYHRTPMGQARPTLLRGPERQLGFARTRQLSTQQNMAQAMAQALRRRGKNAPDEVHAAVQAIANQTPPEVRILRHQADLRDARQSLADAKDLRSELAESGTPEQRRKARKRVANIQNQIDRIEKELVIQQRVQELGLVRHEGGVVEAMPELEEIVGLTERSAGRAERAALELGTIDPEQARRAIDQPGYVFRGGEYVTEGESLARAGALEPEIRTAAAQEKLNRRQAERLYRRQLPEQRQAGGAYKAATKQSRSAWRAQQKTRPQVEKVRILQDELIRLGDQYQQYIGRPLSDPAEMRTLRNLHQRIQDVSGELTRRLPVLERHQGNIQRELEAYENGRIALENLTQARTDKATIISELRTAAQDAEAELNELVGRQQQLEEIRGWVGGEGPPGRFYTSYASKAPAGLGTKFKGNVAGGVLARPQLRRPKAFTGESIPLLTFRRDTITQVAETELARMREQTRLRYWNLAKSEAITVNAWNQLAETDPRTAKHYKPVRIEVGTYPQDTRRAMDKIRGWQEEGIPLKWEQKRELAKIEEETLRYLLPENTGVLDPEHPPTPLTRGEADEATASDQFKMYDTRKLPSRKTVLAERKNPLKSFFDISNRIGSMSLLFTKGPGYVIPNLIGVAGMATVHQGIYLAHNMMTVANEDFRHYTPEEHARARAITGQGWASGLGKIDTAAGAVGAAHSLMAHLYGQIMDNPWRMSGFVHEAKRYGYNTLADRKRLLNAPEGTPEFRDAEMISILIDRAYGEFDRMGDIEKEYVTRAVFFYPWIKASMLYSLRMPIDHPLLSAGLVQTGVYGQQKTEEVLGADVARQFPGVFPTGGVDERGNPRVSDPRSVALFQSPADALAVVRSFLGQGEFPQSNLGQYLTPALSMIANVGLRYDPFTQRGYPDDKTRPGIALDVAKGLVPWLRTAEQLGEEGVQEGSVYGYEPGDPLKRALIGSFVPRTLNMEKAQDIAEKALTSTMTPAQRWLRDHWNYRDQALAAAKQIGIDADGQKLVNDSIMIRAKIAAARAGLHKQLDTKLSEALPIKDKIKAELRVYKNNGKITGKQQTDLLRYVAKLSDADATKWYENEITNGLWEDSQTALRDLVSMLKEHGVTLPDYGDYYSYTGR